ncbi:VTT domain-containing protein [Polyangium spumosum]|uniref:VTT domain-containing protein n=1 Tax=Polyangium spumosum TaxID=889282 RepID=UPI0014795496|nr:VTT domain-containing protein [Polyangium spumosum]
MIGALLLLGVLVGLTASGAAHAMVTEAIAVLTGMLARHPIAAIGFFVLLAAASAMLTFFSSTVLIPVALHAWGAPATFVLLWLGWLAGGVIAYGVGRGAFGPLLGRVVPRQRIAAYERRLSADTPIWVVLLLQLALPSELPGYLLGTLRYRFARYLVVVGVGELPFALGSVFLGESFLRGDTVTLVVVGLTGLVLIGLAASVLRRRLKAP